MERDHGHIDQQLSRRDSLSSAGLSWRLPPPQIRSSSSSYSCGYCKREFRSPQGLGGHMNVHRWDRARLIHGQCSAHRFASPPNNTSLGGRVTDPRLSLAQIPHCTGDDGTAAAAAKPDACRFTASASSTTTKDFGVKNFELGSGVCSHDATEDRVDLELRLGCS